MADEIGLFRDSMLAELKKLEEELHLKEHGTTETTSYVSQENRTILEAEIEGIEETWEGIRTMDTSAYRSVQEFSDEIVLKLEAFASEYPRFRGGIMQFIRKILSLNESRNLR